MTGVQTCALPIWYDPPINLFGLIKRIDTYHRMRNIQPKLDGLILISKYLYDYYAKFNHNIIQIPPLVDKKNVKWGSVKCKTMTSSVNLLYAGSPGTGTKDNIKLIIESLSQLKDRGYLFTLKVIGLTKEQYMNSFASGIPLNMGNCLYFMGRLSHSSVIYELSQAHYQIFFRDNNLTNTAGFPTKFVESISCGTAVITNMSSNINDYIKEGKNGYIVDTTNLNSIIESLEKIFLFKEYPIVEDDIFDYRAYKQYFKKLIDKL